MFFALFGEHILCFVNSTQDQRLLYIRFGESLPLALPLNLRRQKKNLLFRRQIQLYEQSMVKFYIQNEYLLRINGTNIYSTDQL